MSDARSTRTTPDARNHNGAQPHPTTDGVPGSLTRARDAIRRDESARLRDVAAQARDRIAENRDRACVQRCADIVGSDAPLIAKVEELGGLVARLCEEAATDRFAARADRGAAADDRNLAVVDRRHARLELQRAHLDDLTGVFRRGLGLHVLHNEITRARRAGDPFVLAFVDVDDLKQTNDRDGHAAGDAVLKAVADSIKARLRSYDAVVRIGGDEFVCGLVNTTPEAARRRLAEVRSDLSRVDPAISVSVGFAALQTADTLEDLLRRGDADLYEAKRHAA